jgi:hypothetical protein
MSIRELVADYTIAARCILGPAPGVAELHVSPRDPADVTLWGPTPLGEFLHLWGDEKYMGEFEVRPDDWSRQFVAVIDPNDGVVVLVGIQPEGVNHAD